MTCVQLVFRDAFMGIRDSVMTLSCCVPCDSKTNWYCNSTQAVASLATTENKEKIKKSLRR